jgi:hypothetical protein
MQYQYLTHSNKEDSITKDLGGIACESVKWITLN